MLTAKTCTIGKLVATVSRRDPRGLSGGVVICNACVLVWCGARDNVRDSVGRVIVNNNHNKSGQAFNLVRSPSNGGLD